jgi:hypothetical protein
MRYRTWDWVALSLVILGAINWGLIGLFRFDLVAVIFGGMESVMSRIIYTIIALAGLYCLSFIGRTSTFDRSNPVTPHNHNHNRNRDVVTTDR